MIEDIACCSPRSREPISPEAANDLAGLFKALADPTRLRLLSLIASHTDGEACVCELTAPFELSQPTVSHHLKVLHEAGLISRSKRATWVYYRIVPERLGALAEAIAPPASVSR